MTHALSVPLTMAAYIQADDCRGPAQVLTYRPSTHSLQNNSWHRGSVGDKGGQDGRRERDCEEVKKRCR